MVVVASPPVPPAAPEAPVDPWAPYRSKVTEVTPGGTWKYWAPPVYPRVRNWAPDGTAAAGTTSTAVVPTAPTTRSTAASATRSRSPLIMCPRSNVTGRPLAVRVTVRLTTARPPSDGKGYRHGPSVS